MNAREAYAKMARILERVEDDAEKRRIIGAFSIMLNMIDPPKKES